MHFPSSITHTFARFLSGCLSTIFVLVMCIQATSAIGASNEAWYLVRRGDNLSVIGDRFGVTVSDLKRDNNLKSDLLAIGQKLKIGRPFRRTNERDIKWCRPYDTLGTIIREFGPYTSQDNIIMPRTGSDMRYPQGGDVFCPANGVIRYIGPLKGFGTLMIIEHGGGMSTVLAPVVSVTMQVDQAVRRGDPLGITDAPPQGDRPYLHLELRRNDKAISPDRLLK